MALLTSIGLVALAPAAIADSMVSVDIAGDVGRYSSMVLDALGNPVISHYDTTNGDLRLVHCNDPNCDPAVNGPESKTNPDTAGDVGHHTSIALDSAGNPVISHYNATDRDLRLVHCNDPNCDPAVNGPESKTNPDTAGDVGHHTSIALDSAGNPVISHYDATDRDLRLVHCNDPNCDPAVNGPESLAAPHVTGDLGEYSSLALDAVGNPVVSYYNATDGDLLLLHCNDVDCSPISQGPESITTLESAGDVGRDTSLALDLAGYPVVSHYDASNGDLRMVHCNDPDCSPSVNGPEVGTSPDAAGAVGGHTSLALDAAGFPVVTHFDTGNGDLRLVHCNDAACSPTANGPEALETPDSGGTVGLFSSLVLDAVGNAVASYYDATEGDLKVLRLDRDADADTVPGSTDNCPGTPNPDQEDSDADGVGDVCDSNAFRPVVATAAADSSGSEGAELSAAGAFSDADPGAELTITQTSGEGSLADHDDGSWTWTHTPHDDASGIIEVQAWDGEHSVVDTFSWTAANVAPMVVALTPSATTAIVGQPVTFTATATDPSSTDTQAGMWWSFNSDGFVPSNTFTTSFSSCGAHTVTARARDKDGGMSAQFTSAPVNAFETTVLDPLRPEAYNTVQRGQVVPVKIVVGCAGSSLSALHPSIQLLSGDVDPATDPGDASLYVTTASSSSADTTGVMREVGGEYKYNLQVPTNAPAGALFTIRMRPFGGSTQSRYVVLRIRK